MSRRSPGPKTARVPAPTERARAWGRERHPLVLAKLLLARSHGQGRLQRKEEQPRVPCGTRCSCAGPAGRATRPGAGQEVPTDALACAEHAETELEGPSPLC